ncbi:alpha/beta hydrolase [Paraglaciecola aquimarina]|uniref:Alpha/beta hydrolase n=1 Tax=Paraglaciecola algarum TaxID=3050085 RepID=A0ABS9DAY4_9ALTE|nr:alpha/beta family hydrolase [Paraglaciecola sp. G1-23]MCF2950112.1 alpha/beta hydrolase [Paraglaciecola sp. G1-23]
MIKTLVDQAVSDKDEKPLANFVFAHGAGAGQNSEFMQDIALQLSQQNINVIRFNFAYIQLAIDTGKRRPPERADKLLIQYKQVIDQVNSEIPLFIGGKSMGGRMASMLVQDSPAKGCICMGYPFHPPGKPEKLRTAHLGEMQKPLLIIQGERDTFGTKHEIPNYPLSSKVQLAYLTDGDHSFKPRKKSGKTLEQNMQQAVFHITDFIKSQVGR